MDVFINLTMRTIDRFLINLRFKELKQPITKCNKVSMIHINSIDYLNINLYSLSIVLLIIIVQYTDNLLDSKNSDSFNSYWLLVYMFLFETHKTAWQWIPFSFSFPLWCLFKITILWDYPVQSSSFT